MDATMMAERCRSTAGAAEAALRWVADPGNARKVARERPALERGLRRGAGEAARLERAAARPNCVGVFGPSQAGKSYLISILARKDHAPLIATFEGDRPTVDFIRDINPIGGDESTGVVTRFTIRPLAAPAGRPVCLRLLTQADIVKILINSYFQDGDQEYEVAPEAAAIERRLAAGEARKAPLAVDALTEADLWDIQDYARRHAGGAAAAAAIEPFWGRIAALAPLLRIEDRAPLLALLWGGHDAYTRLYARLAGALRALAFEEEAFCAVDALVPSRDSIINVNALRDLNEEGAPRLDLSTRAGAPVSLPRPLVTALIAELRIVCRDRPLPYFDHTDLLDFPGYRSRFKSHLARFFQDAAETAPREVFLRGKVDYLFQRYTSDLELTTMVLCVPDSTLEVPSLPKAVEDWVGVTHGATPEKRLGKPNLLFLALTKFDRTLERKAGGGDGDLAEPFKIRLGASLGPFAKIEPSWVRQWWPGRPFQNLFLIRNPNVPFLGVIDYDGARETGLNPGEAPRLDALRQAFAALPAAREHCPDPAAAWDALMTLNDGGAGRLASAIGEVCAPEVKLGQIQGRLDEVRSDLAGLLRPHYVSTDLRQRRAERLAVIEDKVFPDLDECAARGAFGTALRGLMIDASDLHAALSEALNRPQAEADPAAPLAKPGGVFTRRKAPAIPPPRPDRWARLAGAALGAWASLLRASAEDAGLRKRVGISQGSLGEMAAELGAAARRLDLAGRIAVELKRRAGAAEQNEAVARRAALVAERVINRFVSELDFDRVEAADQVSRFGGELDEPAFPPRPVAYDASGIGAEPPDFTTGFMRHWGDAFRATVALNAMAGTGSIEEAVHNERLGGILDALAPRPG